MRAEAEETAGQRTSPRKGWRWLRWWQQKWYCRQVYWWAASGEWRESRVTPKLKPEQGCSGHLLRSRRCAVQFCTTLREREAMPPGSAAERRKSLAIRVTRQDGESAGGRMTATHCSRFRGPEWRPRRPRQAGHSTVVLGSQNKKPMSWTKAGQSAGWQSFCP